MNGLDYQRLAELGDRVRKNTASLTEKDEYMMLLYRNGSITEQQLKDFRSGMNTEEIMKAAVAVGAVLLIGFLIKELFGRR